MVTIKSKNIIIGLIILNIILIYACSLDDGRGTFWAIPLDFILNLAFVIYSIIKKKEKVIITALILLFTVPIIEIIVFVMNFAFLTR